MAKQKALICPYCGRIQPETDQCRTCHGFLDPLSRQATHNAMGPWFIREEGRDFHPGCGYEMIVKLIERGQITRHTIMRGPTTKQFWTIAKRVPCVAHLLGYCHNCDASVDTQDHGCHACGAKFGAYLDRNYLGLPEVRPLPWEAEVDDSSHSANIGPRIDVPEEMRREWAAQRSVGGARSPAGTGGGRFGGGGGRLSSFASDEELRVGSGTPIGGAIGGRSDAVESVERADAPVASAGTATMKRMMPESQAAPPEQARPEDPLATGIATRALQRRLLQNTRTIQRMMIVLIASLIINLLLVIGVAAGWFETGARGQSSEMIEDSPTAGSGSGVGESATSAEDMMPAAPTASPADAQHAGDADATMQPDVDANAHGNADGDASGASNADDPADPAGSNGARDDSLSATIEAQLATIDEHLKAAEDEARSIADRLAEYDKAITQLRALLESVPAALAEEHDLEDRVAEVERARERLRLRTFFP